MSVDPRALVDEVCEAQLGDESPAALILELLLERRAHARGLISYVNRQADDRLLAWFVGKHASGSATVSEDDVDYIVERLVWRLGQPDWPPQYVVVVLEKTFDERAVEPAIDLLFRTLASSEEVAHACGASALAILATYTERPEVQAAIEAAAQSGKRRIAQDARDILDSSL